MATGSSTLVEVDSDGGLVLGTLAGDRPTFAKMYDRFATPIYDLHLALHRDPRQATEATYATFARAISDLNHLGDPTQLRPWLYTLVYKDARPRDKNEMPPIVAGTGANDPPLPDPQGPLWQGAAELDRVDRALVTLHLRHGLDVDEIARIVDMSVGKVRSRLDKLRPRIEPILRQLLAARVSGHPNQPGQPPNAPSVDEIIARDPAPLRVAVPLVPPPPPLRQQVLHEIPLINAHKGVPRPRTPAAWVTTVTVVLVLVVGSALLVQRSLERKPVIAVTFGPSSELSLSTSVIDLGATNNTATVTLSNTGNRQLAWQANPEDPWLRVEPASGSLSGGKSQELTVIADRRAIPREGDARTELKVGTTDGQGEGSVTVALREERPPAIINARASNTRIGGYGCPTVSEISATVRDESPPLRVMLVGPGRQTQPMHPTGDVYTGRLGSGYGTNISWKIVATDGRNNTATSATGVIQHADCAARPSPKPSATPSAPPSTRPSSPPSSRNSDPSEDNSGGSRRTDENDGNGRGGSRGWPF